MHEFIHTNRTSSSGHLVKHLIKVRGEGPTLERALSVLSSEEASEVLVTALIRVRGDQSFRNDSAAVVRLFLPLFGF